LFDALTAVRLAREFSAGPSFEDFVSNLLVRSAVERQLETIAWPKAASLWKRPGR
jgi:uncharacterized protein with HEPN domain